jgi:hypothetical protein
MGHFSHLAKFPTTAITRRCRIKKLFNDTHPLQPDVDFWKSQEKFHDIALLLNAGTGISCLPGFATSYSNSMEPFGGFTGSSYSYRLYDIIGVQQVKLAEDRQAEIQTLIRNFNSLNDGDQDRFRRVLLRIAQAKRRTDIHDRVLDLGIALEMLLLKDNTNRDTLASAFRWRGAWLISDGFEERQKNARLLKDLYTYRCHVAHRGLLEEGKPQKINAVREQFPDLQSAAEKICQVMLGRSKSIDWERLLLGGGLRDAS